MKKIILLILIAVSVNAQVTQQWVKRYNGTLNSDDLPDKVLVDQFTGDVYVTGRAYGVGSNLDIVTIKYNSAGTQQWLKIYNGTANGSDDPSDMVLDNLGNVIITGTSAGINSGQDCITIKYDNYGNRIWVKRYNGTANGHDYGNAITTDGQGGIIITGKSKGNIQGVNTNDDIITIKYDYFGAEEWVQRYNGIYNSADVGNSTVIDNNNNIYVAGYSWNNFNQFDFVTIKYSPQGSVEWVKKLESYNNDIAYKILNNYQTEEIYSIGKSGVNTIVICYDYSGNVKWQTSDYGAISGFSSAAIDNSGNIFLCGNTMIYGTSDYMIIAYNSSGGLAWVNTYNGAGSGYDYPYAITTDNSNNIYITGYSQGAGSGVDYTTLKYTQTGTMLWEKRYNFTGVGINVPVSLITDNNGNIYVTGYSQNISGNYDYATIKYTQGMVFGRATNEIPAKFKLFQNYPNPFNPATNIKFDIPKAGIVKIIVYDMLGREVETLLDESKEAGSYLINFDASALSSGTYFYRIDVRQAGSSTGEFLDIKKMVLVK